MRALDLYSGVGGWALGLKLAGIEVVASYEISENAAKTAEQNLGIEVHRLDIRSLELTTLPKSIDLVVGSPPCTQFSYSNRGGSGDLSDGLLDIAAFLRVVDYLKPEYWIMENVPRVQAVLHKEMTRKGKLSEYIHLRDDMRVEVVDISDLGLPQRRRRCIAGNFDYELLSKYSTRCSSTTLGQVVGGLRKRQPLDVNFDRNYSRVNVTETAKENFLDEEEVRINRYAKAHHPVYNSMQFPEPLDKPSRTVTATCTRVSRESLVIAEKRNGTAYRRLTVRERASLQGFPISYQFYGDSYSEKLRMIGNAIPPVLTYYLGLAVRGIPSAEMVSLPELGYAHPLPPGLPAETQLDQPGRAYRFDRRFRFAIPELRFKSGMRFDLSNQISDQTAKWCVEFFYGPSTNIQSVELGKRLLSRLEREEGLKPFTQQASSVIHDLSRDILCFEPESIQLRWADKSAVAPHPFELLDKLGEAARQLADALPESCAECAKRFVIDAAARECTEDETIGTTKLERHAIPVLVGMYLGAWFNVAGVRQIPRRAA